MKMSMLALTLCTCLLLLGFACSLGRVSKAKSDAMPITHEEFGKLLKAHVDQYGLVDYKALQADSNQLQAYLQKLGGHHPNDQHWSREEQMAYWINAYNAYTLELILDYYPVNGIKEIKDGIPFVSTVWDIDFIKIEDREYNLNNLEHGILRKYFDEPRTHFALVCASLSCPKLQAFAYSADRLDEQLDQAAREFFNDPFRNDIAADTARVSKILDWYWMDFKDQYADVRELINKYSQTKVDANTVIEYLDYDWALNEQTAEKKTKIKGF